MKQNHMKQILGETASQVVEIQMNVENLTNKVNEGSLTAVEVRRMGESLKEQEQELAKQRKKFSMSMVKSVEMMRQLFSTMSGYHNDKLLKIVDLDANDDFVLVPPPPSEDNQNEIKERDTMRVSFSLPLLLFMGLVAYKLTCT